AVLGWLSRRRLGRVQLAAACGLAAFAAKEVMNLYTWTLGASHTPAAFLAVAGQALSYDVTDTVASLLFGLAFAPELARLLARMRVRLHVEWEGPHSSAASSDVRPAAPAGISAPLALGLLCACTCGSALLAHAPPTSAEPAGARRAPALAARWDAATSAPAQAAVRAAPPRAGAKRAAPDQVAVSKLGPEISFLERAQ